MLANKGRKTFTDDGCKQTSRNYSRFLALSTLGIILIATLAYGVDYDSILQGRYSGPDLATQQGWREGLKKNLQLHLISIKTNWITHTQGATTDGKVLVCGELTILVECTNIRDTKVLGVQLRKLCHLFRNGELECTQVLEVGKLVFQDEVRT